MRATLLPVLCAVLLAPACGSSPGSAGGPAPSSASAAPPAAVPAADGPVTGTGTVIEVPEKGPELCLGPVRESFPPQCEGLPLAGWDWEAAGSHEDGASVGNPTRWGTYVVTGTFDGLVLTVTDVAPLALHDPPAEPSPRPVDPPELSAEAWQAVEEEVRGLPGLLTVVRESETGPVHVDVVRDDGSLQDWADTRFGVGAVRVTSMLR